MEDFIDPAALKGGGFLSIYSAFQRHTKLKRKLMKISFDNCNDKPAPSCMYRGGPSECQRGSS